MKMKHAFSNVTGDGLIAAISALTTVPRLDDNARPQQQVVMIGQHNQNSEWVVVMGDAEDADTTTGDTNGRRVFSSPELSHALYSALLDHPYAFNAFKLATGWSA
jgi:hypothetical protein